MSPTETPTPEMILTRAADILTAQGWTQQAGYEYTRGLEPEESPLDLPAALAKAAGHDLFSREAENPTGTFADATLILCRHIHGPGLGARWTAAWALSELANWQDETNRTAEQVIAALRASAAAAGAVDKRAAMVAGLRELADFIEARTDLPVPNSTKFVHHPDGTDEEERAEVDRIARILGAEPEASAGGHHYLVTRRFGPVAFEAVAITDEHMARYTALMSYGGAVEPAGTETSR
ncbi:DUF6197 family protein [Actinomadura madurae]|uniref:DUF6197 family protein n=1 Tax=Actinomadura madurae TaxID=1993 RepID=UPI0020D1F5A2|nr:hypothetical protein [Actinomadura madurae]MCP9947324.1 hypothetical protein [Actinomadura madurae]MCP9964089.1 hypothetical protein [Actinomadura madurae]MCP9976561.1 hypothetical protein [Actinomadura madurae]MCQ0011941.1 hypothetical protein [Actinomadura madurae]MCQ0012757.1 hypothetical protein [Actinomadura madurae]